MGIYIRSTVQSRLFGLRLTMMGESLKKYYILLRAGYRFLFFVGTILSYFVFATFHYVTTFNALKRRQKLIHNAHLVSQFILKSFNVKLICKNNIPENENSLLVGNHMGFIDIVCLQALRGCVFITSLEMKHTPFLGQITDLGGCAYVNRKNRMNIQDELKGITDVLKDGFRVVLYAESIASDGEKVLPFKKTLLMSAGISGRPIRPFTFNYRMVNDSKVLYEHRDSVCWYGDQTFFEAIWKSLKLESVTCEIEFSPLIFTTAEDDRTKVAEYVHEVVASKFEPFKPEMNLITEAQVSSKVLSHSL